MFGPTLVPVFAERNVKRIFAFTKKQKVKRALSVYLPACTQGSKRGPTQLLPQELHSASQPQAAQPWTVWASAIISIYFVGPLAMCPQISEKAWDPLRGVWGGSKPFPFKLMVIASLLFAVWAYSMFYSITLLSESEGNRYHQSNMYLYTPSSSLPFTIHGTSTGAVTVSSFWKWMYTLTNFKTIYWSPILCHSYN